MAADQRRKRLNGASIVGCSSREQHRTKRKNAGVTQTDLKMKSHISVQWDGHQKKVVAKREQIGISWRNMSPFINSSQHNHNVLADIFTVPTEIFGLNNLTDLLSYETWQNYLTENERNHLSQFLPKELDRDQVVQDLLNCKNFHFGNPFLKWGASLCSGDFHPDAIVSQEKHLKSNKKLHYLELREYHNDMIKFLTKLKERWESCEDPEIDIVQNLRSGNGEERRDSSRVNELPATSESGSWVADGIACSSDNQFSSLIKGEKLQRILDKDMRGKRGGSLFSSDDTIDTVSAPNKGHKLMNRNIHSSDGAKYMSYIKITKRQLELVRSMKKTGQSIQVKSLNRILGDLDGLQVQPYEVFVEEEQKNLRDSWLHLVNEDIPSAYAFWRERQMQIVRMKNLTEEEILEKVKPPIEDEENRSLGSDDRQDQEDGEETNEECSGGESEGSSPRSAEDQSPQEIFSPSSPDDFTFVGTNSGKNTITSRLDEAPQPNTKYSSNVNAQDIPVSQEVSTSSGGPVWQSVCAPHSCYESTTVDLDYSSVNGFSITNPQINEHRESRLIDLEIDMHQEGAKRELLHGYSDDGSFSSYADQEQNDILQSHLEQKHLLQSRRGQKSPNQPHRDSDNLLQAHQERNGLPQCYQDHSNFRSHQNQPDLLQPQQNRNDLLHSLFRDPVILSHHEQNGTGLNFQRHADVMMNNGFSGHFKESLQPSMTLEQGQKRPDEMYLGEHIAEDVYPDGGRFLPARQGHLSSVNVAWAVATGRMPEPSQSHLNSAELLGQHWFPTDQIRGGWTEFDGATLPINTVGSGASSDQGLYSVLSQCNQLKSSIPYNSVRPSDQFIPPRTYGVMDTLAPRINSPAPQPSHPLDFLSGRESGNSLVPDDLSWMSLPPHSSALHDQLGKPFVRSWNG